MQTYDINACPHIERQPGEPLCDIGCCCECVYHRRIYSHPWSNGKPISEICGYICVLNWTLSHKHGLGCEMFKGRSKKKKANIKERHPDAKKYLPEDIFPFVKFITKKEGRKNKIDFDGNMVNMASDRYKLFLSNLKCVKCGIKGKYFLLEKDRGNPNYHFNLYAIDENNEELLMTKDHIIPKSKGGKNHISNYQTMCCKCNEQKGNRIEEV